MDKEKTMRVLLFQGGFMGAEALRVLKTIPNVKLVEQGVDGIKFEEFDIMLSVSYPHRIDRGILEKCKAVNLHSGLLPKQRGYHPLNWAIIWGDKKCGVTLHKTAESIDSGDIIVQEAFNIDDQDFIQDLREKAKKCVEPILRRFFDEPDWYWSTAYKQDQALATYAPKRFPSDSELNPKAPMEHIRRHFRACDPQQYPAFVTIDGHKFRVTDVSVEKGIITAGRM